MQSPRSVPRLQVYLFGCKFRSFNTCNLHTESHAHLKMEVGIYTVSLSGDEPEGKKRNFNFYFSLNDFSCFQC